MKPTTRAQKECVRLSTQLKPLTAAERKWAAKNLPYFQGYESNGKVTCMHCGHKFEDKGSYDALGEKTARCPHCKRTLHVTHTKKESADDIECFVLLDAVEQWQVMRYFHVITQSRKCGTKTTTCISEIMQRWIGTDGKYVIIAKQRNICFYTIRWVYDSEMQVHGTPDAHYYNRIDNEGFCECAVRKMHPALQHVQYDRDTKVSMFQFLRSMLATPFSETLYKQQRKLWVYCANEGHFVNKDIVAAVRVALRHKYDIMADATMWFDHVQTLLKLKKDVRNPAFICPADLRAAHSLYLGKWRRIEAERQRKEDEKRKLARLMKAQKDNEAYIKRMQPYLGLLFTDGNITAHVLRDIAEFAEEARVMKHCVFDNEYFNASRHPNSLILSAQVDGKRTETVEVSLHDFTIQQSRGHNNVQTKYHKRIVSLINSNMQRIRQAAGTV